MNNNGVIMIAGGRGLFWKPVLFAFFSNRILTLILLHIAHSKWKVSHYDCLGSKQDITQQPPSDPTGHAPGNQLRASQRARGRLHWPPWQGLCPAWNKQTISAASEHNSGPTPAPSASTPQLQRENQARVPGQEASL